MEFIREIVEDFGPDRFAFFVYLGLIGIGFVSIIGFFLLSWSWITAIICVFIGFVTVGPTVLTDLASRY